MAERDNQKGIPREISAPSVHFQLQEPALFDRVDSFVAHQEAHCESFVPALGPETLETDVSFTEDSEHGELGVVITRRNEWNDRFGERFRIQVLGVNKPITILGTGEVRGDEEGTVHAILDHMELMADAGKVTVVQR